MELNAIHKGYSVASGASSLAIEGSALAKTIEIVDRIVLEGNTTQYFRAAHNLSKITWFEVIDTTKESLLEESEISV